MVDPGPVLIGHALAANIDFNAADVVWRIDVRYFRERRRSIEQVVALELVEEKAIPDRFKPLVIDGNPATQDTLKDIPDIQVTVKGPVLRRRSFDLHGLVFIMDETVKKIGSVAIRSDDQIISSPDLIEIAISSTPKCESVERHGQRY